MVQAGLSPPEVRSAAAEAASFGFPLLLVDAIRRTHPVGANRPLDLPIDGGSIAPGLACEHPLVVATSIWADLRDGPVSIDLPSLGDRHWSVSAFDAHGRRMPPPWAARTPPSRLVLARQAQAPSADAWQAPTKLVWLVIRIAAASEQDLEAARRLASEIQVRSASPDHPVRNLPRGKVEPPLQPPIELVAALQPHRYFHRLSSLLARFPTPQSPGGETQALARLELGVSPFQMPDSPELKDAIGQGLADAMARLKAARTASPAPGWRLAHEAADSQSIWSSISTLGAPAPADVLTLVCDRDSDGRRLVGTSSYDLVFDPGDAPPADRFWTLICAGESARAALDSRAAVAEPDGSIRVRISQDPPPGMTNVIKAPPGRLQLRLSLFWPQAGALTGGWSPPALGRVVETSPSMDFANRGTSP